MQNPDTDHIVRTVIQEMNQTFTNQETEWLVADEQFAVVASLYHTASRDLEQNPACNQRIQTALERALREHAQRALWSQSSSPTPG